MSFSTGLSRSLQTGGRWLAVLAATGIMQATAAPRSPAEPTAGDSGTTPHAAPSKPQAAALQRLIPDAQLRCPDADFDAFLRRFGHEIAVQERSVADPLLSQYNDPDAQPEPRQVTERIALRDVKWPVMPDPAALGGKREMQISEEADGSVRVLIRTPDTDDQQAYYFERRPCWTLVKMYDQSL